ncbi:MAG: nucleotide exchange factor GrpE [Campylobacterales bacterium]
MMEEKKQENIEEQPSSEEQVSPEEEMDTTSQDEEQESEQSSEDFQEKLKECEDRYLRVHADFENTKKRLEKEKYVALDYAVEKFASELLPALDSLDAALHAVKGSQESQESAKIIEGLELTQEQFLKVFSKHGIQKVTGEEGFNPHLHEAVMNVDSGEHEDGEIVQILQAGYKYKERLLRPALVSICKK